MGLKANADGSGAIQVGGSDAITITSGLNTTFAGTASVATGALYPLVSGTAKAYNWNGLTTNTFIDFDTIPSWVKRITVMFNGVSTNGSSPIQVQLGTGSTTYTTSGYVGNCLNQTGSSGAAFSSGFVFAITGSASEAYYGQMIICLLGSNTFTESSVVADNVATTLRTGAGIVPLAAALTAVRITTTGTDTFDAGSINILYE